LNLVFVFFELDLKALTTQLPLAEMLGDGKGSQSSLVIPCCREIYTTIALKECDFVADIFLSHGQASHLS